MLKFLLTRFLILILVSLMTSQLNAQRLSKVRYLQYDIAFNSITQSSVPYQFSNSQSLRYLSSFNDKLGFDYSGFYNHSTSYPTDKGATVAEYNSPSYVSVTESVMQVDHRKYGLRFGLAYHSAFSRFYIFNSSVGLYSSLDRVSYKLYWEDYTADDISPKRNQYYLSLKSPNLLDIGTFAQISLARNIFRNYYLGLRAETNFSFSGKRDLTFAPNEDKTSYDALQLESRDINELSGYFQKYYKQYYYNFTTINLSLIYQLGFRL